MYILVNEIPSIYSEPRTGILSDVLGIVSVTLSKKIRKESRTTEPI